jgi:DNA-binding Xre family transcriptional regulator
VNRATGLTISPANTKRAGHEQRVEDRFIMPCSQFFRRLGKRVRELRRKRGHRQEDMISFGFSARHWQQIEAGRPITLTTLLRICEALDVRVTKMLEGMER